MKNKITLLGTGTCQLQPNRMASSALMEINGLRVLYDMGRGVCQRLLDLKLKQDDLEHIIISHFHPDHMSDLITYLHAASWSKIDPRTKDLNIYAGPGIKKQMAKLIALFSDLLNDKYKVKVQTIKSKNFSIKKQKFSLIKLTHPGDVIDNYGLKFSFKNKSYAFTADADLNAETIRFLSKVDLAVIDAGHIIDEQIVELAVKSQAKKIVCSHLYRELNEKKLNSLAKKQGFQGEIIVGQDLMSFNI